MALGFAAWRLLARSNRMTQWRPVVAGVALAAAIVFYNWHHKNNPLSPFVMGLCRMLVYVTAALAFAMPDRSCWPPDCSAT